MIYALAKAHAQDDRTVLILMLSRRDVADMADKPTWSVPAELSSGDIMRAAADWEEDPALVFAKGLSILVVAGEGNTDAELAEELRRLQAQMPP